MRTRRLMLMAWSLGLVASLASGAGALAEEQTALVATTPHFAFYSDFDSNLHDALLEAGRDKNYQRPGLFEEGDGTDCYRELAEPLRTAWNLAVDYYAQEISPGRFDDWAQFWIRIDLSGVEEVTREKDLTFIGIARGFREAAAPAYEACQWPARDADNREWVAHLVPQLERHEEAIAARLAEVYRTPLGGLPIRVDVVETVNWSGATTILLDAGGGHIQISTPDRGPRALELVFHEATHTLMDRKHPVQLALKEAAERLEIEQPRDLWHGVQFFQTGEVVRRAVVERAKRAKNPTCR